MDYIEGKPIQQPFLPSRWLQLRSRVRRSERISLFFTHAAGLAKQASQITMYDIKSYYNQAKNSILNVSEMEAKVREATNDDPW